MNGTWKLLVIGAHLAIIGTLCALISTQQRIKSLEVKLDEEEVKRLRLELLVSQHRKETLSENFESQLLLQAICVRLAGEADK